MKGKWYLIPVTLIGICMLFAGIVRLSYTENVSKELYDYQYETESEDWNKIFQENKISGPDDLLSQSDLVAKIQFDGERIIRSNAFYSSVKVENVYKGNSALKGQSIILTETVSVFQSTRFLNASATMKMWVPLSTGFEYIVLLKKIPFSAQRIQNDFQKRQYYPITNSPAGCYLLENKNSRALKKGETTTLETLRGQPLYTFDQQQMNTYYTLEKAIFNKLGI